MELSIDDATPIATELLRRLTDYSAARSGLYIALAGEAVIEAMATVAPIRVEARDTDLRLVARFVTPASARRAAKLMRSACPPVAGGAS